MIFTCLDSAFEEAQFLANEVGEYGYRSSSYVVQTHEGWNVTMRRPTNYQAMTLMVVKPEVKVRKFVGVSHIKSRKYKSKYRASHYHGPGNIKFLGWHMEWDQAVEAVKKYKESLNVISTDR